MSTNLTEEAKKLSIQERIALVEEIWDSIAEDNGCFELTEPQKQELDSGSSEKRFYCRQHKILRLR